MKNKTLQEKKRIYQQLEMILEDCLLKFDDNGLLVCDDGELPIIEVDSVKINDIVEYLEGQDFIKRDNINSKSLVQMGQPHFLRG